MKRTIWLIIFFIILFLLQTAAENVFFGVRFLVPQLLLLGVLVWSLGEDFAEAVWVAFFCGFLLEIHSSAFFGAFIFAFLAVTFFAAAISRSITQRGFSAPVVLVFVAGTTILLPLLVYVYGFGAGLFSQGDAGRLGFGSFFSLNIVWTIAVNAAVFHPLRWFAKLFKGI